MSAGKLLCFILTPVVENKKSQYCILLAHCDQNKIKSCVIDCFIDVRSATTKWATSWETLFMRYANNKGAKQPAYTCSLRSTFIARCFKSSVLKIQNFKILASLWSWAGRFESYKVANPEDRFFSWRGSNEAGCAHICYRCCWNFCLGFIE